METNTMIVSPPIHYSLNEIRDEVRQMVDRGVITRNQPIYVLCEFLPAREWFSVESELERWDYLLRDRIGDLISEEKWNND